ncbi:aminoacyl-tRNA hydrolase [Cryobacterium suzukii]|uniref:Peptidyl-tRNA hydrolase n=1 Tax=Cryobacterium suzukii TaxID=1259198 RepID=A0A4R9ACH3_9MICO|nr:aminoacyl-tRNA hydrolase [Cryobacterium suzukii]TFD57235.1 aminoacyl-tRNA hydrolase [Cryobacterium suzukii]
MDTNLWLVVGLGNPGPDYAGNRHNVGQMVVAELADRLTSNFKRHKTAALVAEGRLAPGGPKLVLARPTTFMNVSGSPVAALLRFYSLPVNRLIVVHDDLDLPFDTLKIKVGGGHGGHNGLRDIIAATGTNDFIRIRMGIGRPPGRQNPADFVLHDFAAAERAVLPNLIADAADAVELIASAGVVAAQQKFHSSS